MLNKISLLLLVSVTIKPADMPQAGVEVVVAREGAAAARPAKVINLDEIIKRIKQGVATLGYSFGFATKAMIYSNIISWVNPESRIDAREIVYSEMDNIFRYRVEGKDISSAELFRALVKIKKRLGAKLNILVINDDGVALPIEPEMEEVDDVLESITSQIVIDLAEVCRTCFDDVNGREDIKRGVCDSRHVFHNSCIDPWLNNRANRDKCPVCKKIFRIDNNRFFGAIKNIDMERVKEFIEAGIDVNVRDGLGGATPLIYISILGSVGIAKLLLDQIGIDINAQGGDGTTALMWASGTGHLDIVNLILNRGDVNINIRSNDGKTALTYARERGFLEIVDALETKKRMQQKCFFSAARKGHFECLKRAIAVGVDINSRNTRGSEGTALIYAIRHGRDEITKHLLSLANIDVSIQNKAGNTALMLACQKGMLEVVELILGKADVNVNIQNKDGDTALMLACQKGEFEVVKLLLGDVGIDVNIHNKDGDTALMLACKEVNSKAMKLLLDRADINIGIRNKEGNTAFMLACQKGILGLVEPILERCDLNVNIQNLSGQTALMMACASKRVKCIELLLRKSEIDINTKDSLGNTALMYSFDSWFDASEPLLKRLDIRLDLINEENKDVLDLAYERGCHALAGKIESMRAQKYSKPK